jgi:di/tricarboxylate transporter
MLSTHGWVATAVLAGTLAAFASGRVRPEVVAMGAAVALGLTGVVSPSAVFAGFGDPAVVTIAALFVVSAGLEYTGVAFQIGGSMFRLLGTNEPALIAGLMVLAATLAGFMNIVAATAVLLPVALAVGRRSGISPSRLLMPLAIASRLGGALTLVGKPSNLIVSTLLVEAGEAPLSFFAFLPVGATLVTVGIVGTIVVGRRLLPSRIPEGFLRPEDLRADLTETYRLPERLFRIRIGADSPLAGKSIAHAGLGEKYGIVVLARMRGDKREYSLPPGEVLAVGDVLLVEARPEDADRLSHLRIEIAPESASEWHPLENEEIGLAEVVVAPRSEFAGKSLKEIEFRQRYALNVIALWREGRPRRTWLADLPLQFGDALLLQGPRDRIRTVRQDPNFVALDAPRPLRRSRAPVAALAVVALVVLVTTGLVPVSLAAVLAAGVMVLSGSVSARETYEAIDWPTVIVIGGLLPLGTALQTSGAAGAIADILLPLAHGSPVAALALVLGAAVVVGHVVPAVPATIVMAPIGLSAAAALGTSPVPFLIAVASATSITLLTPISHPVNLMVMGPGGYRFGDYARVGAPLVPVLFVALLAVVVSVWPL